MKILALEFSSDRRSAAVLLPGREPVEAHIMGSRGAGGLDLVASALEQAGCAREAIECVAVGAGPGSYAGIRGAIALAQGWDLAQPVKLCTISSADCLAALAHAQGTRGIVNVVLDAQRGEFYVARYELGETDWQIREPLRLAGAVEIKNRVTARELLLGPDSSQLGGGPARYPRAVEVALLVKRLGSFVSAAELEPIYLRPVEFVKAPQPRALPPLA